MNLPLVVVQNSSLRASQTDWGSIFETNVVWLQKFAIFLLVDTPLWILPMMLSIDRSFGIFQSFGRSSSCRFSIGCFEGSTGWIYVLLSRFFKKMFLIILICIDLSCSLSSLVSLIKSNMNRFLNSHKLFIINSISMAIKRVAKKDTFVGFSIKLT